MLLNNLTNLNTYKKYFNYFIIKKEHKILANTLQIALHQNLNKTFIQFLKKSIIWNINQIIDFSAIDKNNKNKRFLVSYLLLSEKYCNRLIIRIFCDGIATINSIGAVFKSSTWLEREVFDMFGIFFKGNIDLRRILTDYGFKGYPLRKDFPVFGFTEKYFSLADNIIVNNKISLIQEFRFEQKKI